MPQPWLDATAQAEAIVGGDATPAELVDAAVDAAVAVNGTINAIVLPRFEAAREQARTSLPAGAFSGVPFLIKDLGATFKGDPAHSGMQFMKDRNNTAGVEMALAARFRDAGLVSLGRTNTPELGLCPTTEPSSHGPTRNPWDPARSAGGSSGGSAAAVAARIVPVAHGSDGGGSLRIPASCCGIVGLKPTRGRLSQAPVTGEAWHGFATEGVMSVSIRDMAGFMDVMSGPVVGDPYTAPPPARPFAVAFRDDPAPLKIGMMTHRPWQGGDLHPDCVAAVEHAATLLEGLGHTLTPDHPDAYDEAAFPERFFRLIEAHAAATLDLIGSLTGTALGAADVEPYTWFCAQNGRVPASEYIRLGDQIHIWARRMARFWENYDLLLTPTVAEPPPLLGDLAGNQDDPQRARERHRAFMPFTPAQNATGDPAISLPLFRNGAGLPIGVQLVAPQGGEALLLQVARQLETVAPWSGDLPPIVAGSGW